MPVPAAVPWAAQLVAAAVLAQTLFFKFTYAPETAAIFADRGGRPAATVVGVLELAAAVRLVLGGRGKPGRAGRWARLRRGRCRRSRRCRPCRSRPRRSPTYRRRR